MSWPSLDEVPAEAWEAFRDRRVFFGHQSVGRDVMRGVEDLLARHGRIQLRVVEDGAMSENAAAGFYHARIGRNREPRTKIQAFVDIVGPSLTRPRDVGMLKLCYVDMGQDDDPAALFDEYRCAMDGLREGLPGLTLVHCTIPVTVPEPPARYWTRRARRDPTERRANAQRGKYNALLRGAYAGREPVFDVAALESTRIDGTKVGIGRGAAFVEGLDSDLTHDGGHLNETGRRAVAEQLLLLLAGLGRRGG